LEIITDEEVESLIIKIKSKTKDRMSSEIMSTLEFSMSPEEQGTDTYYIDIELSSTPVKFRRLSLNLVLRIILCKMAAVLKMDVTSWAVNNITAHTLCELGFQIKNTDSDKKPIRTCEHYKTISNKDDADVWETDENMFLEHGDLKIPLDFENKVKLMSNIFPTMIECLPYTNTVIQSLVTAIYGDVLVSELRQLPLKSKIILKIQYYNVKMCELCIAYRMGDEYQQENDHISSPTFRIPFVVRDNTVTLLSIFDAESFTGVSMYKLVLCVLCNICIARGLNMRIYPNNNSGSLKSQIESLEGLGFEQEQSTNVVNPLFQEPQVGGVEDLGYIDEDIAMVFYSEGKQPFTKDDMDPRLFPDSGEGFWTGGGGEERRAGKAPLGGDNAALALFGLFVTAVAAGFSSAKPLSRQ
jgi:hypothetical protein